jgi:hypothetical protein
MSKAYHRQARGERIKSLHDFYTFSVAKAVP